MTRADRVVAAARAAVGTRFRLHGRDVAHGLDCVGLVRHALAAGGFAEAVPDDYGLRGGDVAAVRAQLDARLAAVHAALPGDVLLLGAGPAQLHLAIRVPDGLVHADATARRVIERPGAPPWPVLGVWRLKGEA